MTKTNNARVLEQTNETKTETRAEMIQKHVLANKMSTSAVIRYVAAQMKGDNADASWQDINRLTYNFIKSHLPTVTTKSGGEIRYQHVRGVMTQILTSKN